jgi:hypothetical protein
MGEVKRRPQPRHAYRTTTTEVAWTPAERRALGAAAHELGLIIITYIRMPVLSHLGPGAGEAAGGREEG